MEKIQLSDELQRHLNALRELIESHDDIQALLDNSATWADGKSEGEQRARRNAWRVACGAGALAVLAFGIAGAAILTSMRPAPPPKILVVERSTGKVDPLVSLPDFQASAEDVTIRRCVANFMRARENYSYDTAEDNYRDAAAFMSAPLQAQWVAYWDTANPKSPMNTYRKDGKVRIELGAITILRNGAGAATGARVSFTRSVKRNDQPAGPVTAWIATIPFKWANEPTSERDRRVNDLGWQATAYDVDADLGNVAAGAAPVAAPAAPAALSLSVPSVAAVVAP